MTDTMQQKIINCIRRHPEWKDRRIAKACSFKGQCTNVGEVRSLRPGGTDSIIIDEAEIFVPPDQIDLEELLDRH